MEKAFFSAPNYASGRGGLSSVGVPHSGPPCHNALVSFAFLAPADPPAMRFQSDAHPLSRILLRHARHAFVDAAHVEAQWRELHYLAPPDFEEACRQSDAFGALLEELGVEVVWADGDPGGLDSIYVRDPSVLVDDGAILCRMGKGARHSEPDAMRAVYRRLGIEVLGAIEEPGTLEGGDTCWLDASTLAVGRGYRTNDEGIAQLRALVEPRGIEVVTVPMPHWRGPEDVFHLMSIFSPLAPDLALVHAPLLPVPFREELIRRGIGMVEMAPGEYDSQGCNVLAVAPRVAVAVEGNRITRARMEEAGVEVHTYPGSEISVKGEGGPTCLTRPLDRDV